MKNLTKQFSDLYKQSEGFQQKLGSYSRAMKSEDWKFLTDAILIIKGQMAVDLFSRQHTNLSKEEKDVVQKTYYNISLILDFLLDPQAWIRKKIAITDLLGKVRPSKKGR